MQRDCLGMRFQKIMHSLPLPFEQQAALLASGMFSVFRSLDLSSIDTSPGVKVPRVSGISLRYDYGLANFA